MSMPLKRCHLFITFMCAICSVHSPVAWSSSFDVNAGATVQRVLNANRQTEKDLEVDETQLTGLLTAVGLIESRYIRFESDANYEVRRYSEFERQNNSLLLGDIDLRLGNQESGLFGGANYSAEEQLIDLNRGDSADNKDLRAITTGQIGYRLGRHVNRVEVFGYASNVAFDVSSELDSSQIGAALQYTRPVSPTAEFGVVLDRYTLEYKSQDEAAFDYTRVGIRYQESLRRFNYNFFVGSNTIKSDDFDKSSPFYEIASGWRGDLNQFNMQFRQWLTDTSQGSRNSDSQDSASGPSGPDGRLDFIDQFKRRDANIRWNTQSLCFRCEIELSVGGAKEDYRTVTTENSSERYASLVNTLNLNNGVDIQLSFDITKVEFDNNSDRDYKNQRVGFRVGFDEIFKSGQINLVSEWSHQELLVDAQDEYSSASFGIEFWWGLYSR